MTNLVHDCAETVGDELTDNNAHFARTILDWTLGQGAYPYTDEELEIVRIVGKDFLARCLMARRSKTVPDFQDLFTLMQNHAVNAANANVLERQKCQIESDNHSPDLIEIWDGNPNPTFLCGYHESRKAN